MVTSGQETGTRTVLLPGDVSRLRGRDGQENGPSHRRKKNLFKQDVKQTADKLLHADCAESVPHTPIIEKEDKYTKDENRVKDEEEKLPAITNNLLLTEDVWRQKDYLTSVTSNMDLAALLRGSVRCHREKPPSTKETRREAFDQYMHIIYRLPPNIQIDLEDTFDPDQPQIKSFHPDPDEEKPCNLPAVKEDVRRPRHRVKLPVNVEKKKEKKAPALISKPKSPMEVKLRPADPKTAVRVTDHEEPPEVTPPIERSRPPSPDPPGPETPEPPPPRRDPTPEVPTFLRQFTAAGWFKDLYPDEQSVPTSLSPEDFSLQLLDHLNTCSAPMKMKILAALETLHSQGLLQNPDQLHRGLVDLVPRSVRPNMAPVDRAVLVQTLKLLMSLQSDRCELVKTLLTLLAFKELDLREPVLSMLTALGVNEAERWLSPEVDSWDWELQDRSNIWKSLHDGAESWLDVWISKYNEHQRYLRSSVTWQPVTFGLVDVLDYFCSVQKEEYRKAQCAAPPGLKNTVVLPPDDGSSQPIIRLGETYSMSRVWRPPGVILPPLRNRPSLTHCPGFISLPVPRVTLRPFHVYSDADWVTASPRRYFILQQSYVDYYR